MDEILSLRGPRPGSPFSRLKPVTEEQYSQQSVLDALRESEARFRTLADCAPVVVWMTDVDCSCTYISRYWREFTGRDPAADLGFKWVEALHPEDRERAARDLIDSSRSGQECRGEYRVMRANGKYGWLADHGVPLMRADGSYSGHIGTCTDITDHKKREKAGYRIQDTLLLGQESERKRVALELHDDIGQRIAVLSVAIEEICQLLPDAAPSVAERLNDVKNNVIGLAGEIHRISHNLHPSSVTHLGLVRALRRLCQEFSIQMPVQVDCACDDVSRPIPENVALALFRVTQECLTNVAKHSQSGTARVSLTEDAQHVRLTISDEGIGFDVNQLRTAPGGLGLVSIRERSRMIGADVDIRSAPSSGTTIELRVPLHTLRSKRSMERP